MEQTVEAGTVASVVVNVIDDTGSHVAATIDTATTRLQKGDATDTTWNNATPSVDEIATGVYRIKWTGLSPAIAVEDNDELLRVKINGSIDGGSAWTEYHMPLKVLSDTVNLGSINGSAVSASNLAASASMIKQCAVDTATNSHSPTETEFQTDALTEATADHFKGRIIYFKSGNLEGQAAEITEYTQVGGIGQVTVTALTEAPADGDEFLII